jgi:hypothetical protein
VADPVLTLADQIDEIRDRDGMLIALQARGIHGTRTFLAAATLYLLERGLDWGDCSDTTPTEASVRAAWIFEVPDPDGDFDHLQRRGRPGLEGSYLVTQIELEALDLAEPEAEELEAAHG